MNSTWHLTCALTLIQVSDDWSTDVGPIEVPTTAWVRCLRPADRITDGVSSFCQVSFDDEQTWVNCRTPTL